MAEQRTVRRWLRSASPGYCGPTDFVKPGDLDSACTRGESGSFGKPPATDWSSAVGWCLSQCALCIRCRHISVSLNAEDCSWYMACPRLHKAPVDLPKLKDFRSGPAPSLENRSFHLPRASSKEARMALRKRVSFGESVEALPFFSPHDRMQVAICFFGKIGTLGKAAGQDYQSDPRIVYHSHSAFVRHVLAPNPRTAFDVFAHTWSPEMGHDIDALYQPVWSKHQPPVPGTREEKTSILTGTVTAHSASRSVFNVLRAKRQHEKIARGGRRYDLVWVLRCDLVFFRAVSFSALAPAQLWFARQCCKWVVEPGSPSAARIGRANGMANEACLGQGGNPVGPCYAYRFVAGTGKAQMLTAEGNNYFVNDWFFMAPSSTADSFGEVHLRFEAYQRALLEVGIGVSWLHFLWAAHVHAIRAVAGVRPALQAGVDFTVLRFSGERFCLPSNLSVPMRRQAITEASRPRKLPAQLCGDRPGRIICSYASMRCASEAEFRSATLPLVERVPDQASFQRCRG